MVPPKSYPHTPVYRLARVSLLTAVVAFGLACYGSFVAETHLADSPLRQARGEAGLPAEPTAWSGRTVARAETAVFGKRLGPAMQEWTARSPAARYGLQFVAFVLPLVLGVGAAWMGGNALTTIEGAGRKYVGNFHAVFALLIGGLAAVISGCMLAALFLWRFVPAGYTT
jgi:hypothetical protein